MPCEFEPQCAFCHQGNFVFPALMILSFNSMEKDKTNQLMLSPFDFQEKNAIYRWLQSVTTAFISGQGH